MTNNIKIANSITLVAGLWLMVSAFTMGVGLYSNLFVIGILTTVLSLIGLSMPEQATWFEGINGILGAWLLISPLFLSAMGSGLVWNSVIVGLVILISAFWGTMSSSSMGQGHPRMG